MNPKQTVALRRAPERVESNDFSVAEVLAEGVGAWLTQLPAYAGVALLLHLPLLSLAFLPPMPVWLLVIVFGGAELVVTLLVKAALTKAVLDAHRGLHSTFLELLEALNAKAPAVLAVGLLILARAAGKMFKLVLPGIVYLCETFAAVPEIVAEDTTPAAAVRRSEQLIEGARLRVFGICALIWSLSAILVIASGLHRSTSRNLTWVFVYLCTRSLDSSLAAALSATTYQRLFQRPQA